MNAMHQFYSIRNPYGNISCPDLSTKPQQRLDISGRSELQQPQHQSLPPGFDTKSGGAACMPLLFAIGGEYVKGADLYLSTKRVV